MLAHVIAAENSRPRIWLLKIYARHEVRLLKIFYRLLNSPIVRLRVASELLYWTLAYPTARWGIVGTPVSLGELDEFFSRGTRFAVGPCRCRLAHGGCNHPLQTDIVVRTGFPVWTGLFPSDYREVTAQEAKEICIESNGLGMAQIAYAHLDTGDGGSFFVMCNCCADGCLPLLAMRHYGPERYPLNRGRRRAFVEMDACRGCGTCLEVCVFEARSIGPGGKAVIEGCYGCGQCASHCPAGATALV